jgi:hypothetical protein
MRTSKKIGLVAFIISEVIIIISALFIFVQLSRESAGIDDLAMIIYAQTGILGIVWGSQGIVNYAKNRNPHVNINDERLNEVQE